MTPVQKEEIKALVQTLAAITMAIKECGPEGIPSGHLYAMLMDRMDINAYQKIIHYITGTGLVEQRAHVLRWVGR